MRSADAVEVEAVAYDVARIAGRVWDRLGAEERHAVIRHLLAAMDVLHPESRRRGANVIPLRRGRS